MFLAHFWSILSILGENFFFLENPAMSHTTSYGFLAPCQNFEKTKDAIPRKRPDRQKDRRTVRPHFIGPFQLPLGVQKGGLNIICKPNMHHYQ